MIFQGITPAQRLQRVVKALSLQKVIEAHPIISITLIYMSYFSFFFLIDFIEFAFPEDIVESSFVVVSFYSFWSTWTGLNMLVYILRRLGLKRFK